MWVLNFGNVYEASFQKLRKTRKIDIITSIIEIAVARIAEDSILNVLKIKNLWLEGIRVILDSVYDYL